MQLQYTNEQHTTIRVTLDEGESLGHLNGPVEAFVPVDEANMDYAAILERGLVIRSYEAPVQTKQP